MASYAGRRRHCSPIFKESIVRQARVGLGLPSPPKDVMAAGTSRHAHCKQRLRRKECLCVCVCAHGTKSAVLFSFNTIPAVLAGAACSSFRFI